MHPTLSYSSESEHGDTLETISVHGLTLITRFTSRDGTQIIYQGRETFGLITSTLRTMRRPKLFKAMNVKFEELKTMCFDQPLGSTAEEAADAVAITDAIHKGKPRSEWVK